MPEEIFFKLKNIKRHDVLKVSVVIYVTFILSFSFSNAISLAL